MGTSATVLSYIFDFVVQCRTTFSVQTLDVWHNRKVNVHIENGDLLCTI